MSPPVTLSVRGDRDLAESRYQGMICKGIALWGVSPIQPTDLLRSGWPTSIVAGVHLNGATQLRNAPGMDGVHARLCSVYRGCARSGDLPLQGYPGSTL